MRADLTLRSGRQSGRAHSLEPRRGSERSATRPGHP